jgi:hypothetical protein
METSRKIGKIFGSYRQVKKQFLIQFQGAQLHIQNVERQNVERQNVEPQNVKCQNVDNNETATTRDRRHFKKRITKRRQKCYIVFLHN